MAQAEEAAAMAAEADGAAMAVDAAVRAAMAAAAAAPALVEVALASSASHSDPLYSVHGVSLTAHPAASSPAHHLALCFAAAASMHRRVLACYRPSFHPSSPFAAASPPPSAPPPFSASLLQQASP